MTARDVSKKDQTAASSSSSLQSKPKLDNKAVIYPPVDFSFRDLEHCSDIAAVEPRKGMRRKIRNLLNEKLSKDLGQFSNTRKEAAIGTIKYGTGAREELKKLTEKDERLSLFVTMEDEKEQEVPEEEIEVVQQYTGYLGSSIKLSNNYLTTVDGLEEVMKKVMFDSEEIKWLDLSYNQITSLESVGTLSYNLDCLQLHSNQISSINEVLRLRKFTSLKSLTLHGNPLEETKNYRYCVIAILPWLRSLDFNHITKKDRETADTFKKLFIDPLVKRQLARQAQKK